MLETKKIRLEKYSGFSDKKRESILCPVCNKSFTNKYSLSNHFIIRGFDDGVRFIDDLHKIYWENKKMSDEDKHKKEVLSRVYEKWCWRCKKIYMDDFDHRFSKQCPECRIKFPSKKKNPQSELKKYPCPRCGNLTVMKLSGNNKICENCRKKEKDEKIRRILATPLHVSCLCCGNSLKYYRKSVRDRICRILCDKCKNDPCRFKNHYKYSQVIELLEKTDLTRREIKELLNLEIDYVREAAEEKFGDQWYNDRVKFIRNRAGSISAESNRKFFEELRKDKERFDKWFNDRSFKSTPSSLEKSFVSELGYIKYSQNQWKTLLIKGKYERREIDVKIPLGDSGKKFVVFIDGEAFHGGNTCSCFKTIPMEKEIDITKAFSELGYFTVRYSETEIKNGMANKHFSEKYSEFLANPPKYYYRNWMTNEEIVRIND